MIAPEDEFLPEHLKNATCKHDWIDAYNASGLSKKSPNILIMVFFCKKCLAIRQKSVDVSSMIVSPETLELYEDEE